ncbi:GAF domain-containing protein, partial [Thermus sp.]|uniref:GAF domain-containing protein n=1 Tax=Thermus sp. TaxID=275 RepID=UPI003D0FD3D1
MKPLARLRLDMEGIVREVEAEASLGLHTVGMPCAHLVDGKDAFGRPLCARCPALRELRRGAYRASTPLVVGGRRLRCQVHREGEGFLVELYPERAEGPNLLREASYLTQHLLRHPEAFAQGIQDFLRALREALSMEAAELFLADPEGRHLLLTAYDGPHREAFLERPWFAVGEGYPGIVALRREPLITHALQQDPRYLRKRVKALGYQTYVCFPLELPHGLIGVLNLASRDPEADHGAVLEALGHLGPLLAATLYTVLTRLGEAGLEALGAALRQGLGTEATERFLAEVRRFSQAAGVRLVGRDGHRAELGWLPPCGMRDCP